jgi:hypothetical protein
MSGKQNRHIFMVFFWMAGVDSRVTRAQLRGASPTAVLHDFPFPALSMLAGIPRVIVPIHHRCDTDATGIGRESERHEGGPAA